MCWRVMACSGALACLVGCASIATHEPRFLVVFDQRTGMCRMQIIRDTRSPICFAAFKCGRDDAIFLLVDAAACVP